MDRRWRLSLADLMRRSFDLLRDKTGIQETGVLPGLEEFFRGRLQNLMTGRGTRHDLVTAVLERYWSDPVDAADRVEALSSFSKQAGFTDLMLSFKRVMNIIPEDFSGRADDRLATQPVELKLLQASRRAEGEVRGLLDRGEYAAVLKALSKLKVPVDEFFDGVLVMDKDDAVKENRLAILAEVSGLFAQVADFRKVVTE